MVTVTEAGKELSRDCYFEECEIITDQAMKVTETTQDIYCKVCLDKTNSGIDWTDFFESPTDLTSRLAEGLKHVTSVVKELSLSADFAAESAKTFIAVWRDGKWVPTENRSSRRKMGVGGKRW
jgi:hypothetical protein